MAPWLVALSWASVGLGIASALAIALDILAGRRQHMWIMNLVWPLTALDSGLLGLWFYARVGRAMTHRAMQAAKRRGEPPAGRNRSLPAAAALGATHCGSGCALGDLVAEWFVVAVPVTLLGMKIFGTWVLDCVLAFAFGIAFQYFTIKPMRNLSTGEGVRAALRADAASLTVWQVGMTAGWQSRRSRSSATSWTRRRRYSGS
ncbi:MAG TPA: DUF4396 domain-containing protein [Casimicrobiaceae bacterium]|nr:DUF4396 domain-containing protein [Casimicrobiaceae bacterium]